MLRLTGDFHGKSYLLAAATIQVANLVSYNCHRQLRMVKKDPQKKHGLEPPNVNFEYETEFFPIFISIHTFLKKMVYMQKMQFYRF